MINETRRRKFVFESHFILTYEEHTQIRRICIICGLTAWIKDILCRKFVFEFTSRPADDEHLECEALDGLRRIRLD